MKCKNVSVTILDWLKMSLKKLNPDDNRKCRLGENGLNPYTYTYLCINWFIQPTFQDQLHPPTQQQISRKKVCSLFFYLTLIQIFSLCKLGEELCRRVSSGYSNSLVKWSLFNVLAQSSCQCNCCVTMSMWLLWRPKSIPNHRREYYRYWCEYYWYQ